MPITGGCLCGKVRYTVAVDQPTAARQCWCRVCQYLSAGGGAVNAAFPKEAIAITGAMTDYVSVADSGSVMHRRFCSACGTPLFSEAEPRPQVIFVRVGTLDDPSLGAPAALIWTKSAPSYACFDPALPKIEGQPPPANPKA